MTKLTSGDRAHQRVCSGTRESGGLHPPALTRAPGLTAHLLKLQGEPKEPLSRVPGQGAAALKECEERPTPPPLSYEGTDRSSSTFSQVLKGGATATRLPLKS